MNTAADNKRDVHKAIIYRHCINACCIMSYFWTSLIYIVMLLWNIGPWMFLNSGHYRKQSCVFSFIYFFFIWVLWPIKIISLILSWFNHKVGRKWEISEKKHLTTRKQNLVCLPCDPSRAPTHSGEMTTQPWAFHLPKILQQVTFIYIYQEINFK